MTAQLDPILLTPTNFRRVPWKNGGGVSTTFACAQDVGGASDDWSSTIWQFGRTEIVTPAPFSDLSGYDRMQVVVSGRGLVLETPNGDIDIRTPLTPVRYDGGLPVVSKLEAGPVGVVNLIGRRKDCAIDLIVLSNQADVLVPAGRHIIYAPTRAAKVWLRGREFELPADHALQFEGVTERVSVAGVVLVASVTMKNALDE